MFCTECGHQIPDGSKFCSQCGAAQVAADRPYAASELPHSQPSFSTPLPPDERMSVAKILGIVGACIVAVVAALAMFGDPGTTADSTSEVALVGNSTVPAGAPAQSSAAPAGPWSYRTSEDKVRGTTTYFAETVSTNEIQQAPPYGGGTTMAVTLRYRKGDGNNIMLQISEGQLMCSSYDGCDALVRFDDKPARRIQLVGASDSSSEVAFVSREKSFLASLLKAKRMTIEKTIYQGGSPQWEFDVSGLKWKH